MEIRDLESLGPLVASSLRSAATAQGPRLSKSRISTDSLYNLYILKVVCGSTFKYSTLHAYIDHTRRDMQEYFEGFFRFVVLFFLQENREADVWC